MTKRAAVFGLLVSMTAGAGAVRASSRVEVPDVDWFALLPYLEANVNVTQDDERHATFGTFGRLNRDLMGPDYAPALDELAKVLIVTALEDQDVRRVVGDTVKAIEQATPPSATRTKAESN